MTSNCNLHKAKTSKNDEFYTLYSDIEKEIIVYKKFLVGKTIYCNCDDYTVSNFYKYFSNNFEKLSLKKLIVSCYKENSNGYGIVKTHEKETKFHLQNDGDFSSKECLTVLEKSDIIITNPPFSLLRKYIECVSKYNKSFLFLGPLNCVGWKEVFPLIQENKLWVSNYLSNISFLVPNEYENNTTRCYTKDSQKYMSFGNICWFTNIENENKRQKLTLTKQYDPEVYPKYLNYNGINIDKVPDIPYDYSGVMGVPITFLSKFCPTQFKIVGFRKGENGKDLEYELINKNGETKKVYPYSRILIKKLV